MAHVMRTWQYHTVAHGCGTRRPYSAAERTALERIQRVEVAAVAAVARVQAAPQQREYDGER